MKMWSDDVLYNTETAIIVCEMLCTLDVSDPYWHSTAICRTPMGRFFLWGEGNRRSMWTGGGTGIIPISADAADVILARELAKVAEASPASTGLALTLGQNIALTVVLVASSMIGTALILVYPPKIAFGNPGFGQFVISCLALCHTAVAAKCGMRHVMHFAQREVRRPVDYFGALAIDLAGLSLVTIGSAFLFGMMETIFASL